MAARISNIGRADPLIQARAAFPATFVRAVDPDSLLPPEERTLRGERARKAWLSYISFYAAQHKPPPLKLAGWLERHVTSRAPRKDPA